MGIARSSTLLAAELSSVADRCSKPNACSTGRDPRKGLQVEQTILITDGEGMRLFKRQPHHWDAASLITSASKRNRQTSKPRFPEAFFQLGDLVDPQHIALTP
jgi:hypothetical protein